MLSGARRCRCTCRRSPKSSRSTCHLTPSSTTRRSRSSGLTRYFVPERPGSFFQTPGGTLGVAFPGAVGVKMAHPDRTVIGFGGDGGALYTFQALWTAAHYRVNAKFVVCNNRSYRLLKDNLVVYWRDMNIQQTDFPASFDIHDPEVDYVALAKGLGVPGHARDEADGNRGRDHGDAGARRAVPDRPDHGRQRAPLEPTAATGRDQPMPQHAVYLGREWNIEHDQRAKVSNAELRYTVLGEGEPVLFIHGTSIADSLITPLRFFPPLFEDYKLISYYRAGYNGSTLDKSDAQHRGRRRACAAAARPSRHRQGAHRRLFVRRRHRLSVLAVVPGAGTLGRSAGALSAA